MPDITDDLHLMRGSGILEYTLKARSSFGDLQPETDDWQTLKMSSFKVNASHEHLVSEGSFVVSLDETGLTLDTSLELHVRLYSEIYLSVKMYAHNTAAYERVLFRGHIHGIDKRGAEVTLRCFDPLFTLNEAYLNLGNYEATNLNIEHDSNDVTPGTLPPDGAGVTLVGVTENSEERWIVPWEVNSSTCTNYQEAYAGGSGDADYSGNFGSGFGSGSHTFQAGANRRQWKVVGRVYDTGMDLDAVYGIDKQYPDPLPEQFYRIGSDTMDYLEFIGYTPSGQIFVEWVVVYEEGTNEIEDILLQAVNPDIKGTCTNASPSTTVLQCSSADFLRDNVVLGASVELVSTGQVETIVSVDSRYQITTTALGGGDQWDSGEDFVIRDGNGNSPRWIDGVHYELSGGYWGGQTVFPSGQTLNSVTWFAENGSILKFYETVLESAAPNYRPFWNHTTNRLHLQFIEQTPFDSSQPYYPNAFGKFIAPPDGDATDQGTNDYHTPDVSSVVAKPDEVQGFFTRIIVEGVNEHPTNVIQIGNDPVNTQVITTPPQTVSGWNHNTNSVPSYPSGWYFGKMWAEGPSQTYSEAYGTGGYVGNCIDDDAGTGCGWYTDISVSDVDEMCPFAVYDAGQVITVGMLRLWAMWSKRPFKWNLRLECCDEDGALWDAVNSEWYINTAAKWTLMHPNYFYYPIAPWESVSITDGWLKQQFRYVLVSMTPAKVVDEDYGGVGLSVFQLFKREVVTGQARVDDWGGRITFSQATNATPSSTVLQDSSATFVTWGVAPGDEVYNCTDGSIATVVTVDSETQITTGGLSYGYFNEDDYYEIRPAAKKSGLWATYEAASVDDGLISLNLPRLHQQVVAHNDNTDWGKHAEFIAAGHRSAYYTDHSLSHSDACALAAQRILAETVRRYRYCGSECKWHIGLQLYQTVELIDPYTGDTVKALVENITWEMDKISFDATHYSTGAWTRETPESF